MALQLEKAVDDFIFLELSRFTSNDTDSPDIEEFKKALIDFVNHQVDLVLQQQALNTSTDLALTPTDREPTPDTSADQHSVSEER